MEGGILPYLVTGGRRDSDGWKSVSKDDVKVAGFLKSLYSTVRTESTDKAETCENSL